MVQLALGFAAIRDFPFQELLGLPKCMEKSLLGFKRLSLLLQLGNITQTILFAGESGVAFARNHGRMFGADFQKRGGMRFVMKASYGIGAMEREGVATSQIIPELLESYGSVDVALRPEQSDHFAEGDDARLLANGGGAGAGKDGANYSGE